MNHLEIEIMKNVEPIYIENYNTAERNEGRPKEWRDACVHERWQPFLI